MAVLQTSTVGVTRRLRQHHPPRLIGGGALGPEFSNLVVLRVAKGNRTKKGSVAMEQEGHSWRADVRGRGALETALTTLSWAAAAAAPEQKASLADITKGDCFILDKPRAAVEELKSYIWGDQVRRPLSVQAPASFCQHRNCKLAIEVSLSGDNPDQQGMNRGMVSRRGWLLLSGLLADVLAVPRRAHGLSRVSHLADNNLPTGGNSVTNANGNMFGSTESQQQSAEDVKSWYRYRGQGFVIRVPPGYEDVLDPEYDIEDDDDLYGKRAKDKPFAARFASPDRDEVLSIVIKPASQLRLSFVETKDITDFGSIKEAAPNFVPPGAKLVSARIINSKASRIPRTYYTYEFLVRGMHFMLSAGVSKGNVFVLGASTPQSKWKDYGNRWSCEVTSCYLVRLNEMTTSGSTWARKIEYGVAHKALIL